MEFVIDNTYNFISSIPKKDRKKYGQFFTSQTTACFMASLFTLKNLSDKISILDAGAGTGILCISFIDRLINEIKYDGIINLTCYETDSNVIPILRENLTHIQSLCNLNYEIIEDNYVLSQSSNTSIKQYDYIIGNPPYLKIGKDAPEALALPEVCHGAPNLYFLFFTMGIKNLKEGHELIYIIPRSWTSGAYFSAFRQFLLTNCRISDVHLFVSRNKVFDTESVLQETIIIKVIKTQELLPQIKISSSEDSSFSNVQVLHANYDTIVNNNYVYLVTNEEDLKTLAKVQNFSSSFEMLGSKMKTGLIVDFRTPEVLRDKEETGAFPLIYAQHIKNGKVVWPIGKIGEYILTDRPSFLQKNSNFLIVKRFTSKEEKRRLQCGIFLKEEYPNYKYISTQNKVNFIENDDPEIIKGLYVIFNSTLYDNYYRILNGSTQVNSTEINSTPIPSRNIIKQFGKKLDTNNMSVESCDKILDHGKD